MATVWKEGHDLYLVFEAQEKPAYRRNKLKSKVLIEGCSLWTSWKKSGQVKTYSVTCPTEQVPF